MADRSAEAGGVGPAGLARTPGVAVDPSELDRPSVPVTGNLPFDEWTGVFGSERLTGAPLDRLARTSTCSR